MCQRSRSKGGCHILITRGKSPSVNARWRLHHVVRLSMTVIARSSDRGRHMSYAAAFRRLHLSNNRRCRRTRRRRVNLRSTSIDSRDRLLHPRVRFTPEEERRLIRVVRATSELDIRRRRPTAGRVRLHMVILQEAALRAAPLSPDVSATPASLRRECPGATHSFWCRARRRHGRTSTTLQILQQHCQRAIEDLSRIALGMACRPSACTRRSFACVSAEIVNCSL
jgi:hypothetical protein